MCYDDAKKSLIVIATILFLGAPAHADFMEGWQAYQRGDFETALQQWTTLAERGDPVARIARVLGVSRPTIYRIQGNQDK